jgi:hypothetical protein
VAKKRSVWIVYLHGHAIERVVDDREKDAVKSHLINNEGFDPNIVLKRPWEK